MERNAYPATLNERDASLYIGMSRSWLAQGRMRGHPEIPPYLKIGRSVRYLRADLDQWLKSRRCGLPLSREGER